MRLLRTRDGIEITVEDNGPGIADASLEQVFEPFHRLEASRNRGTGGVGLGLTIARQAAEEHGGTLTLANRPGGGLCATMRLPRAGAGTTQHAGLNLGRSSATMKETTDASETPG